MSVATLDNERLQKLFYFTLKKTGNPHEAEELVQETALEIFKMLDNGYRPENFNAWMWTVIKKRYARWCKNKQIRLSKFEADDLLDYSEIACDENVEDTALHNEDIELLRRELALMVKDYREIIVSYYFDNKKIDAISKVTGLPEGTVKRKLYEARKNIKEGMKMARTKGQRSYAPEEIDFSYNVTNSPEKYPLGRPLSLMKMLAAKNIALEAYNNPSSVEELSLSLGIAAPYKEIYEGEAYDILSKCYDSIYKAVSNSQPNKFKKNSSVKAAASVLESLICVLMRYAYSNGFIKIPEEDKSAITMYMRF